MSIYKKCIPDGYFKSIFDINYNDLKANGKTTLLFDLDNTIITYDEELIPIEKIEFLNTLKNDFKILIISNSRKKRVKKAAGNDFLYVSFAKKPFKFSFKKAMKMLNSNPSETVVIGDQLMTDIYGAKRLKMTALLVEAVSRKTDKFYTRINRGIEKRILKKIRRKCPDQYDQLLREYEQKSFVKFNKE